VTTTATRRTPPHRLRSWLVNALVALPAVAGAAFLLWSTIFRDELRDRVGATLLDVGVGDSVPRIDVEDATRAIHSLPSLIGSGGATLVVVDLTTPQSRAEVAFISAFLREGTRPAAPVVIVSAGDADAAAQQRELDPRLTIVQDVDASLAVRYGLRGTPIILRADSRRKILGIHGGQLPRDEIRRVLFSPIP